MCPIPKLDLIRVSNTFISFDQFARFRNCSWSEFLVQTLLLIIGSRQNYTWPESPRNIFLLIGVLNTLITPDQESPINILLLISVPDTEITPDQSIRYIYLSWSLCPILKLILIRDSVANISLEYRVLSKLLLTRISDKYTSLDQCARYRNSTWSESPVRIFLLMSVPDIEITPDQSFWCKQYPWI